MKLDEALAIDIVDETPSQIESSAKAELNEDITYDSDDDVLPKDVLPIGFASKPKPEDEEIFDDKVEKVVEKVKETTTGPEIKVVKDIAKQPDKEEVKEEIKQEEAEPPISLHGIPTIKLTKKGRPRKPMTEEHKAKLAIAREKAMAKKKYLANERKIAKMKEHKAKLALAREKAMAKKKYLANERKIAKMKAQEETQSKKDEEFKVQQEKQKVELEKLEKKEGKPSDTNRAITRADLEEMSMKTLIAMETMRKKRKAEKKKAQQEKQYQQEVMDTIKKAQPSWIVEGSPFNNCF